MVWVPKRERNETLDCFNYSLVALHILQPDLERIANKTEAPIEEQIPTENKKPRDLVKERRAPRKKKSFVKDW